jgi:hypothetical protein
LLQGTRLASGFEGETRVQVDASEIVFMKKNPEREKGRRFITIGVRLAFAALILWAFSHFYFPLLMILYVPILLLVLGVLMVLLGVQKLDAATLTAAGWDRSAWDDQEWVLMHDYRD